MSPLKAKDVSKFWDCNKLIARGCVGSSSEAYRICAGSRANVGFYESSDVVGVSVNGARPGRVCVDWVELALAVSSGCKIVLDCELDRGRSYNVGDREVCAYLVSCGMVEDVGEDGLGAGIFRWV